MSKGACPSPPLKGGNKKDGKDWIPASAGMTEGAEMTEKKETIERLPRFACWRTSQ
ncbi:hypothetical protein KJ671_02135 [Patescibacteria group bacterium]|nr:hypothetical protein [Patescibacteria group bacterium]